MTYRVSLSDHVEGQQPAGINRRNLIIAGTVAAGGGAFGVTASWLFDNSAAQVGDGSGGATPPPATPQPASTPAAQQVGFVGMEPVGTPMETPMIEVHNPADVLDTASILELRAFLDAGEFTVEDLTRASLDRIRALDGGEIALNAIITLNAQALHIAAELDAELAAGTIRGPLHGIPVVLKDTIATADRMPNTAGSVAMKENIANRDAYVTTLLRDAGAVILGKTNLTEWANYMGETGLSGWSSFGGLTVNPHNLNKTASGSSTGSAVAVAAGYVPLAIGAEFDGSIISPAAINGVVGLKPTVGLIGRSGIIPIGFTRDSLGTLTKTVEDAALALEILAGYDPDDPGRTIGAATAPWVMFDEDPVPDPGAGEYLSALRPDALQGARIGVLNNYRDNETLQPSFDVFDAILPLLIAAGAELVPDIFVSDEGLSNTYVNSLTEFAWGLQHYLDEYTPDGPMHTIEDIVVYNEENARVALERTDQSGLIDALTALPIDDPFYLAITEANVTAARTNGLDWVMNDHRLDAIIAPTASVATNVHDRAFGSTSSLTTYNGYPSISIPMGMVDGLPVGLHIFGRAYSEARLLGYAYAIEQVLPPRVLPAYLPRVDDEGDEDEFGDF